MQSVRQVVNQSVTRHLLCLTEVDVEAEQVTEQDGGQQAKSDGDSSQARDHCCCCADWSHGQEEEPHCCLILYCTSTNTQTFTHLLVTVVYIPLFQGVYVYQNQMPF